MLVSLRRAEERIGERLTGVVAETRAALGLLEARLQDASLAAEARLGTVVERSAGDTQEAVAGARQQVGRLGNTYGKLLDAQTRRTLEGLFEEDALAAQEREAAALFAAGRYVTASDLYREIAQAHPEDTEARFYRYYALFLSNRQNRDAYRSIQDAFTLLERQGYTRRELTETLAYIAAETAGGPAGGPADGPADGPAGEERW
jgi:tetratricopeptide (TPR) repeat protein